MLLKAFWCVNLSSYACLVHVLVSYVLVFVGTMGMHPLLDINQL